ncbi:SDR family oxidoreductase [Flavobacterium sp. MAH-1]|uniref:SDR family oxidoreductase n=1 Tax=Flavobacterium agri TaxID=2743471 RepID=A0A7Y8Y3B9_9FLAO|nr:SDR family oxidoreductase [Flavobacterium agri]NUY81732.1 SDR family oxidoreductase [Flavobacterium agri]NYA71756.1 SDR family oxidoreductase [Flavobacterium agri]
MRVFVTGASGFVGSAIAKELLDAGHQVIGLARSNESAKALKQVGADVYFGNLDDTESLKKGVSGCDAVIHTAFNHDFSTFKQNCEDDRRVITALGEALIGSDRPLVITSGIGLLNYGRLVTESDVPPNSDVAPRAASEEAANAVAKKGVNTYIVRLPPTVHGQDDHGFVPMVIAMAKENSESVYIGQGDNRWPAVHRLDAATLYRLIIEQQPEQKVFHAIAEQGVPFREIATAIGKGLGVPTIGKDKLGAEAHFGWFLHFASFDCPASSESTKNVLGWHPKHMGLLKNLDSGAYFEQL